MKTASLLAALLLALPLLALRSEPRTEVIFAPTGKRFLIQKRLAEEIAGARKEIRVAMFHFTSDRLAQALAKERRDGVKVRVLLDAAQSDPAFVQRLRDDGLDVRLAAPAGNPPPRFHHKFAVIDGKTVLTGSYNWTVLGDMANHENVTILREESAVRAFADTFDNLWNDQQLSQP